MFQKLIKTLKSINNDLIIYYISFVFCIGIVFQGQTKIPLTFGIVFMSFFWLIKPNYSEKWKRIKENKAYLFFLLFYLFMGLSAFWTDDLKNFGRLFQLKLSFFLIGLVWSSTLMTFQQVKRIVLFFSGVVALHLLIDQIYITCIADQVDVHDFSLISQNRKHYIALYSLFSFGGVGYYILNSKMKLERVLLTLLALFLAYNILFIGSRIHILGMITIVGYFLLQLFNSKLPKRVLHIAWLSILSFILITYFSSDRLQFKVDETKDEIVRMFDKTSRKNPNPRVYIWPEAIKAINETPIIGQGLGDSQKAINKYTSQLDVEYWIDGDNKKFSENTFNCHSQFLEILLQTGIVGLLIFGLSLFYSFKRPTRLYIIFAICFIMSMFTESIFERQFGVVFFAFFYPLLLQNFNSKQ